jgi:hypothetical protein
LKEWVNRTRITKKRFQNNYTAEKGTDFGFFDAQCPQHRRIANAAHRKPTFL